MDLAQEWKSIEDYLIPKLRLDYVERALYYHLVRHTRVVAKESSLFGILSLSRASGISEVALRERMRTLHDKGCVRIEERSGKGHVVRVFLPGEIDGLVPAPVGAPVVDVNEVDFFADRKYVGALVKRENGRCFYCLRAIDPESCVLDHVIPQAVRRDNSFRNVVASCHECNAVKRGEDAAEFLRAKYRAALLSQEELQERLTTLDRLQSGQLIPDV
jgi:HNH endonuclease